MDDEEYYRKIREQYSPPTSRARKIGRSYSSWEKAHGSEDAQMLNERERAFESDTEEEQ